MNLITNTKELDMKLGTVVMDVETTNSGCTCKFQLEDKYGKYMGTKPHSNWEVYSQNHSNDGFAHYIQCTGCDYQLAKKYWKDKNRNFVDYSGGLIR